MPCICVFIFILYFQFSYLPLVLFCFTLMGVPVVFPPGFTVCFVVNRKVYCLRCTNKSRIHIAGSFNYNFPHFSFSRNVSNAQSVVAFYAGCPGRVATGVFHVLFCLDQLSHISVQNICYKRTHVYLSPCPSRLVCSTSMYNVRDHLCS